MTLSTKATVRAARVRRQRGYVWEDTLVKRFCALEGWVAFRLGSPSTELPDVLAVSSIKKRLYVIEAKSGTGTTLAVPCDQIVRCMKWTEVFGLYKNSKVVLAFKFLSKKRLGRGQYGGRQLREFFKEWDAGVVPTDCTCTYDGKIYSISDGRRHDLALKDCKMPF